ncbi:hypothetical protein J3F84DRAFT_403499 [Trichoderma pleuroticola]
MVITFPCIKFGLMVGIGGGVPARVRVGDVVVGTPEGPFPGVVQWDIGKSEEEVTFELTGALNKPPDSLLKALAKMESRHEMDETEMPKYLDALKESWPKVASKYLQSDSLEDVLFKSNDDHPYGDIDEADEEEEENCRFYDEAMSVRRKLPLTEGLVHYGMIASGNQVIKDAAFRNKLIQDLDGYILCFETEAAGLPSEFPCVVIRGICDYANLRKNDAWQRYAAARAAALAKELLRYVSPEDVEREPPAKDKLQGVTDGNMAQPDSGPQRDLMDAIERKDDQILQLEKQLESNYKNYENIIYHKDGILEWQAKEILELCSKEQTKRGLMDAVERKDCQLLELEKQLESNYRNYEDNIRQKDGILEWQAKEILELRSKEQTERQAKEQAERYIKGQAEQHVKEKAERRAKEKAARKRARAQLKYGPYTPLHGAARSGRIDEVKSLLSQGANIGARAEFGRTPLFDAVWSRQADVAKLLISRGVDTESMCPEANGGTLLHLIAYGGKGDMVELLLDQGANIEAKDDDGNTPLISAIRIGNENAGVVKLLLDRGADVDVEDEYGNTPLQFATRQGYRDVVKLLLD